MNQERRFPKIIEEKSIKKTGEPPVDENLFEGFDSLWPPTLEGVKGLGKELSEYPEFKPKLTFFFPLDRERKEAIKALRTGEIKQDMVFNLLESDDFVKRDAGMYFLDKIKGFSKESIAKLQSILEDKKWTEKNSELAEKLKVKIILETKKDKALDTLIKIAQDGDKEAKAAAVWGLGELGDENALPVLEKLFQVGQPDFTYRTAEAKAKIVLKSQGEKSFPLLTEVFLKSKPWPIQLATAEVFGTLNNKKSIEVLKEINLTELQMQESVRKYESVKQAITQSITKIIKNITEKEGEKAMPWLKEKCRDKNESVSQPAARTLTQLIIKKEGEMADEVLKETFEGYDEKIREAVDFEKNKHAWLLGTQKAIFATAYSKKLTKNLLELEKISSKLKEKFGDKFIGLNVFGSASKGYSKGKDIDFGVIADFEVIAEKFGVLKAFDDLTSGDIYYEMLDETIVDENDILVNKAFPSNLFSGLFIGDYRRLTKIQKKFLESVNKDRWTWDRTREIMIDNELNNFEKLAERFGLTNEELENLKWATILARIPLTYEETRKIIDKRFKIVQKNEKSQSKA